MPAMPIEATLPVSITLQAQQWNLALDILSAGPYRTVAPLIQAMTEQIQAAATSTALITDGNGARVMRRAHDPS